MRERIAGRAPPPPNFVREALKIGYVLGLQFKLLDLRGNGQAGSFPAIDISDTLQPLGTCPYFVDLNLKVRVVGAQKTENDTLKSGTSGLALFCRDRKSFKNCTKQWWFGRNSSWIEFVTFQLTEDIHYNT
ncbi:MAG: hypothetical protein C0504_15730 [Candidatus Solibacter sp.]|nr:hypothetical protein [Candidatus Solibacter sp.]